MWTSDKYEDVMTGRVPESYEEAAAYIEALPRFTKKHSLEHTKDFLRRLGNPAVDRKIIHVAGTNGKGSVCAFLQAILMAEGKQTGFFTSPHLISVNERIRRNNVPVDDETFFQVFCRVVCAARQMEEEGAGHPSYFEFLFGMGMQAFSQMDVEYIILETGLGGRLDATNSIEHPALSVITSISLDHTDILGDTIAQIAGEKAGIIKRGVPVLFDGSNEEAAAVIRQTAVQKGAPCKEISNHAFEIQEVTRKHIAFSRLNAYDKYVICKVSICGCCQAMNAEIALEAAEYLMGDRKFEGTPDCTGIEEESGRDERRMEAVASVRWEGRMEQAAPHLIIDGAHNPGAVEAFVESVKALGAEREGKMVVLFSAVGDKKYEQMIEYLCTNLDVKAYVVTEVVDSRGVPAEELGAVFRKYTDRKVVFRKDIDEALHAAESLREGEGDIYCLGSLYLAGMIRKRLKGGTDHA